jgi:hypothetical protein
VGRDIYGAEPGVREKDRNLFIDLNKSYVIHNIFPNFQLNLVRGNWVGYQIWPLHANKLLWTGRFYFTKPKNATELLFQDYSRLSSRDNLMADVQAAERSQHGLLAGLVRRWVLQDEEIAIQHFSKVVSFYTSGGAAGL